LHCAARSAVQGAEGLSATDGCVGGSLPAESPSRALRAASWKGGIQGEGKGAVSPRRAARASRKDTGTVRGPNGVRPKASQSAKDFLIELPEGTLAG
jgi:hypothetical protein